MAGGTSEGKSKRPSNTAFKQQRLRAWQPLLTPKSVLPAFFIVGIIFAPIGGWLLWASERVNELQLEYTNCKAYPSRPKDMAAREYTYHLHGIDSKTIDAPQQMYDSEARRCSLIFDLPKDLDPDVFLYYRLTKFYQNHRRYAKSFDVDQLKGKARSRSDIDGSDCDPLDVLTVDGVTKPIYPCGLIANSLFNDTIGKPVWVNPANTDSKNVTYEMTDRGISWEADKRRYNPSKYKPSDVYPPPNWRARYPDGYTDKGGVFDPTKDEHFQVWMRTAGLPTFRKLYMKNTKDVMKSGRYQIDIQLNYDTDSFGGSKAIVLSTTSFIGGRNPVLGIAFIVVGGLCVLLGCIFTIRHIYRPRRLGDHTYLSWNQQVQSGLADNSHPSAASGTQQTQGANLRQRL